MVSATKINKNTPFVGLINYKISRISKNRILPNYEEGNRYEKFF